jgi:hypothetical protein
VSCSSLRRHDTRQHAAARIDDDAFDDRGGDLRCAAAGAADSNGINTINTINRAANGERGLPVA